MIETMIMNLKHFQRGWTTKVTIVREFIIQQYKKRKREPHIKKITVVDKEVKTIIIINKKNSLMFCCLNDQS